MDLNYNFINPNQNNELEKILVSVFAQSIVQKEKESNTYEVDEYKKKENTYDRYK